MRIVEHEIIYKLTDRPGLVHCSDQLEVKANTFISVWYQGAYETSPDTVIMLSRKSGQGGWSLPEVALNFHGAPLGNPVLWRHSGGERIYIIFSVLTAEDWKSSLLFSAFSDDYGMSWSTPTLFISQPGFMAKTKPVENERGDIVFPIYHEATYCPYVYVVPNIDSPLESYLSAETMARGKAIQPALCKLPSGEILMTCRTRMGSVWESISFNEGYSWSILNPTALENPDSSVSLVTGKGGEVYIIYNPDKSSRHQLAISKRGERGKWITLGIIKEGEGEYSYPSAILHQDGVISITYTDSRYAILRTVIDF
ncbi:MAG: exo-alpha-sialidase [Sphaerochaetaceae bacterium]